MEIKVLFQSVADKKLGRWIVLPAQNNQIDRFLEDITIEFNVIL